MTAEERFDRIERNLDAANQILVGLAERQSDAEVRQADTETKLNAFISSVHEQEDEFREEIKELLRAQVLMADQSRRTDQKVAEVSGKLSELSERLNDLSDKLNVVIDVISRRDNS